MPSSKPYVLMFQNVDADTEDGDYADFPVHSRWHPDPDACKAEAERVIGERYKDGDIDEWHAWVAEVRWASEKPPTPVRMIFSTRESATGVRVPSDHGLAYARVAYPDEEVGRCLGCREIIVGGYGLNEDGKCARCARA